MIEWLTAWGVSSAVGFLFQPVMQKFAEDLGKDVLKDVLKDVVKGLPGNILGRLEKDEINKAVGQALKEFLEIFQDELLNELEETEVKQYSQSLTKFLRIDDVKVILGKAFHPEIESIDTKQLEKIWYDKNLLQLPADFDWRRLNKPYCRKVKAIIRESDKLRNIFNSYQQEKTAKNTTELVGVTTDFDLPRYQEALQQKYGYLKLDSLDTSGSAYNELKLRSTFIIQNVREFERVVPQALEKTKEYQKWLRETNQKEGEFNPEELEGYRQVYQEAPIVPVTDIINNRQSRDYSIVLGDPGAGKSTLLQFLALNWAESTLSNSFTQPIPILIELRTYVRQFNQNKCKNFLDFLHQAPGAICHLNQLKLDEQFKAGNALVMFDGLDEIFDKAKREDIITDIIRFTDKYPSVQVIVTSRVIGYKPERFRNAEFRHFMLQDFDSEQIEDFINRWHQLAFNDKNDAEIKKERLNRALKSSKAIQELAGNPLLLTMMAILSRHRELPKDRITLYQKAAEVLLQQWDAERYLIDAKIAKFPIDLTDKQAMLRQVAYQMQANEKGLTGNLINGDDLQNIFQAYLENIGYQKLDARKAANELINQLRERNFILCHAGDNYYAFVHRTFLEYFCAEAFRIQFEKEQKLTLEELKTEVYGKHWQDEAWDEVLKLIAGAIDAKFVGEIIEYLWKQTKPFVAADYLLEVKNRNLIKSVDTYLFEEIKYLTKHGRTKWVRSPAIKTLARVWKDRPENPEVKSHLKSIFQNNEHPVVVKAALEGWLQVSKNDLNTIPMLKQLAQTHRNSNLRCYVVTALARNFKDNKDTLPWLKQRAQTYEDLLVQYIAVEELAQGLAQGWKNEPGMFEFFYNIAVNDSLKRKRYFDLRKLQYNPRQTALEIILKHYPNHPQTLPLLEDRAKNDPDEQLRKWAKKILDSNPQ